MATVAPRIVRPSMRAYNVPSTMKGTIPWSRAKKLFAEAHNYWVTTVHPAGRPNSTAVWGVWLDGKFWFSCATGSRKAKNLALDAACTITTDRADEAVIIEGTAAPVRGRAKMAPFVRAYKKKYDWDMDPAAEGYFVVTPHVGFAFIEQPDLFHASATKYEFAAHRRNKTSRGRSR